MNKKISIVILALAAAVFLFGQTLVNGYWIFVEDTAATTPASGTVAFYAKTDGLLYSKDDAGTETLVSGGSGGNTTYKATADSTFTCAAGSNPIGEVTFTSGQLAVGDVLSFRASMVADADTGDTLSVQYSWNSDTNPLANTKAPTDTGLDIYTVGSCVITSSTAAHCWAQDLTTAGAPDGAAVPDVVTLNDITASSNTLGYGISSCTGAATATVQYNVIEQM